MAIPVDERREAQEAATYHLQVELTDVPRDFARPYGSLELRGEVCLNGNPPKCITAIDLYGIVAEPTDSPRIVFGVRDVEAADRPRKWWQRKK